MIAVIKYIFISNKMDLLKKVIMQTIVGVCGILLNYVFIRVGCKMTAIYNLINVFVCIVMFILMFNIFVWNVEKIRRCRFDEYLTATSVGYIKLYNGILLFDGVCSIFTYVIANIYYLIVGCVGAYTITDVIYKKVLNIFLLYYLIKFINIIFIMLFRDLKFAMLLSLLIMGICFKFINTNIEGFVYNIYLILNALVILCVIYFIECICLKKYRD